FQRYRVHLALLSLPTRRSSDLFPPIRILGTAGWIIAGLLISYLAWDKQDSGQLGNTFIMASVASIILGLFSFTLPNTPPMKKGEDRKSTRLNSSHVKISYAVFC